MAPTGWILTEGLDRLKRLVRAQGEMAKVLEARIASEERQLAILSAKREKLDAMTIETGEIALHSCQQRFVT